MTELSDQYPAEDVSIQLDQNICLSAGAGSGKTRALVEMYCALISGESSFHEPIAIERIVAITFTEKAATEMKKRVREALELKLRLADGDGSFWQDRLRRLEWAPIKTIHSFCAGIMREYPVEANVDPAFAIVDEYEAALELGRIVREVVVKAISQKNPAVEQLVSAYGFSGLGDLLQDLSRQISASGLKGDERGQLLDKNQRRAETSLATTTHRIQEDLARLDAAVRSGAVTPAAKSYGSIKELLRYWHTAGAGVDETAPARGSLLLTLEHFLAGRWPRAVSTIRHDLLQVVSEMREASFQLLCREYLEGLQHLLDQVLERYRQWKGRQGLLDFDDLLVKTRDLVRTNTLIRRALKGRFQVIMLDEFQDTNRVQKDIVYYLAEDLEKDQLVVDHQAYQDVLKLHPRKLFIVGDPKQSIYAFRGADVGVFREVESYLAREGTDGRSLSLSDNFRCHPGIVQFANRFFSALMQESGEGYEVPFRHRDHQRCQREVRDEGPRVELITIKRGEGSGQKRSIEAAAVCRRILEIVDPAGTLSVYQRDGSGGEHRKPHPDFSDIAILFRRFTHVKLYERELRKRAIPYYVVKGRGFFGCQEIRDLINYLKYLDGETDEIALVGILRSPLVGVSDETLYLLLSGVQKDDRPVTARVLEGRIDTVKSRISGSDYCNLSFFIETFKTLRAEKDRRSPAELIEKIVQATHLDAILLTTFQGEQKVANVRKLIELARRFSRKERGLLRDFTGYLLTLVEAEAGEPEAQTALENADVVKLMTIHQAKGLEFPVVFIPDMGHVLQTHFGPVLFDETEGLAMKYYDEAQLSFEPTMGYREITHRRRRKEYAESKRLLYVAATRARDYLIMSGEKSGRKGSECWRGWLDQFLLSHPDLVSVLPEEAIGERAPSPLMTPYQLEPGYKRLARVSVPGGEGCEARARQLLQQTCWYTDPPADEVHLTVTALSDYLVCPRRYYYLHRLGLDEGAGTGGAWGAHRQGTERLTDRARGNLVHFVLKQISLDGDLPQPEEEINGLLVRQGVTAGTGELEQLTTMVLSFLKSRLGKSLLKNRNASPLREFPFTLRLRDAPASRRVVIQGAIDLLFWDEEGGWTVVDYKYAAGREIDRKRYTMQLMTYGLAVLRLCNQDRLKLAIKVMEECDREAEEWYVSREEMLQFEEEVRRCAREIAGGGVGATPGWSLRGGVDACHFPDCRYRENCFG